MNGSATKVKGNLTELKVMTKFMELGYTVSIPYGDNSKYDFIAEVNDKLLKIQVKTSTLKGNSKSAIHFPCRTTQVNCKRVKNTKYSAGCIDYFATIWKDVCYLVPANECSAEKTLRLEPAENNQTKKVNFADDYRIDNILKFCND